jgi:hypothetical protein
MPKSIFISHVHEDAERIAQIELWKGGGLLGDVAITKETNDFRQMGEEAIKKHLRPRIKGCAAVLVLIGNDTHNHHWIDYEVQVAKSEHKQVIAVRIKGHNRLTAKDASQSKTGEVQCCCHKTCVGRRCVLNRTDSKSFTDEHLPPI